MKIWQTIPTPSEVPLHWAEQLNISKAVLNLLWKRGIDSIEKMDIFLSPKLQHLARPEQWNGMLTAIDLLEQAALNNKHVLIWGDYDVDGVTGSTVIRETLEFHNIQTSVHLPDRKEEGYGVNIATLEKLAKQHIGVLLTVDCGISDVQAIEYARKIGFITIIADHHLPPENLPPAHAICNPRIGKNPCPDLAGVGIAFFLMAGLNSRLKYHTNRSMDMRSVLDLVALGTLADMAKTTDQNRVLIKNGLLKIAEASRPGIAALKAVGGYGATTPLSAGQVVFSLAPRINAAGRLGNPKIAHELLFTKSPQEASEKATLLDQINKERREEEQRIFKEALAQGQQDPKKQGLVLYSPDWHQGVIGIVASKITEELSRPTLILCSNKGTIKGSGRSIAGFDLHAGLCKCSDLFLAFGGHKQAAGFTLMPTNLDQLKIRFDTVVRDFFGDAPIIPKLPIDMELSFKKASDFYFLKNLELLQPFGIGNPEPVFSSFPLILQEYKVFGVKKEHVRIKVAEEHSQIVLSATGWNLAKEIKPIHLGSKIQLAYTVGFHSYKGIVSIALTIKDWTSL